MKVPQIEYPYIVPLGGNSWVIGDPETDMISGQGIRNWSEGNKVIDTFFRTNSAGNLDLAFSGRVLSGHSKLEVSVGEQKRTVEFSNTEFKTVKVGSFERSGAGYRFAAIRSWRFRST